jgi:hypothetical protein
MLRWILAVGVTFIAFADTCSAQPSNREAKNLLHDTFTDANKKDLAKHKMNNGPGWKSFGGGSWEISRNRARISRRASQDVIAADAGTSTGTLTCDLITPTPEARGMDTGLVVRLVDNDNYWLIALRAHPVEIEVYKKVKGEYHSLYKSSFTFAPQTIYRIRVTVDDKKLTALINNVSQAQIMLEDGPAGTYWGLRDNSAPDRQPGWDNFKLSSP